MKFLNILMILSILLFNSCSLEDEQEKDAEIKVYVNDQEIVNNEGIYLGDKVINDNHNNLLTIKNVGDKNLEISSITCINTENDAFTFIDAYDFSIAGGSEQEFGVFLFSTFQTFGECRITISSNASNALTFIFVIQADLVNP